MTITLSEAIAAVASYNKIKNESFSLKTAYRLAKLFDILQIEVDRYSNLIREALLTYSVKNENGSPIISETDKGQSVEIDGTKREQFEKEIQELENSMIEIEDTQFSLEDFDRVSISAEDIKGLLPFITEE